MPSDLRDMRRVWRETERQRYGAKRQRHEKGVGTDREKERKRQEKWGKRRGM